MGVKEGGAREEWIHQGPSPVSSVCDAHLQFVFLSLFLPPPPPTSILLKEVPSDDTGVYVSRTQSKSVLVALRSCRYSPLSLSHDSSHLYSP